VAMTGMALIVLAVCYYLSDIRGYRRWTKPFVVYGMNAITIFVLSGVIGRLLYLIKVTDQNITLKNFIYQSLFASWLQPKVASLVYAFCFILFMYGVAWLMYRKKIFIKI
jgi:predicted acyltransferase